MKRHKILITIDLFLQSLLILAIITCAFLPIGFFGSLVFLAVIGGWQVLSSIICVWSLKDKKRYTYLIIVVILYGVALPIITTYHPDLLKNNSIDIFSIVYAIFNPVLIGIWYYIITWQDFIKIRKTEL